MQSAEMKSESKGEEISDEEAFALAVYYFIKALELLAADASEQCKVMAGAFVAWEIRDNVCRGAYILSLPGARHLTQLERNGIASVVTASNELPVSLLAGAIAEDATRAMNDPQRVPLRAQAAELLEVLAPTAARSADFLGIAADNSRDLKARSTNIGFTATKSHFALARSGRFKSCPNRNHLFGSRKISAIRRAYAGTTELNAAMSPQLGRATAHSTPRVGVFRTLTYNPSSVR